MIIIFWIFGVAVYMALVASQPIPDGRYDAARGKPTGQSSILQEGCCTSDIAVNGQLVTSVIRDCSITQAEPTTWWGVDLLVPHTIHSFRIMAILRTDEAFSQLINLTITVSNETYNYQQQTEANSQICVLNTGSLGADTVHTLYCPDTTTTVSARYVTISKTNTIPMNQFLVLCEVIVEASCLDGKYGTDCAEFCGNCFNQSGLCDSSTGACMDGCELGYKGNACDVECEDGTYGVNCSLTCSTNCVDETCNKFTNGTCVRGCKPGYVLPTCVDTCTGDMYGQDCLQVCGRCANGVQCDSVTGLCPADDGCEAGWDGDRCDEECPLGTYGANCQHMCPIYCYRQICDKFKDEPECLAGCLGYTNNCTNQCVTGFYGLNCNSTCPPNCNGTCNNTTGYCTSPCPIGLEGGFCDIPCQSKTYGMNCELDCYEDCLSCHNLNGSCLGHCRPGFTGQECEFACTPGYYGMNCETRCGQCGQSACDGITGECGQQNCAPGYQGVRCDEEIEDNRALLALGIIAAILFLLGCFVALVYSCIFYQKTVDDELHHKHADRWNKYHHYQYHTNDMQQVYNYKHGNQLQEDEPTLGGSGSRRDVKSHSVHRGKSPSAQKQPIEEKLTSVKAPTNQADKKASKSKEKDDLAKDAEPEYEIKVLERIPSTIQENFPESVAVEDQEQLDEEEDGANVEEASEQTEEVDDNYDEGSVIDEDYQDWKEDYFELQDSGTNDGSNKTLKSGTAYPKEGDSTQPPKPRQPILKRTLIVEPVNLEAKGSGSGSAVDELLYGTKKEQRNTLSKRALQSQGSASSQPSANLPQVPSSRSDPVQITTTQEAGPSHRGVKASSNKNSGMVELKVKDSGSGSGVDRVVGGVRNQQGTSSASTSQPSSRIRRIPSDGSGTNPVMPRLPTDVSKFTDPGFTYDKSTYEQRRRIQEQPPQQSSDAQRKDQKSSKKNKKQ